MDKNAFITMKKSNELIKKVEKTHFIIRVKVIISPTFLAWIFQFGNKVKILSPDSLINQFKNRVYEDIEEY